MLTLKEVVRPPGGGAAPLEPSAALIELQPPLGSSSPSPRALRYSLIHLIERLLDQAGNLSKGRRGKPAAIWLSIPLSF